jgi:hypothetical protein
MQQCKQAAAAAGFELAEITIRRFLHTASIAETGAASPYC